MKQLVVDVQKVFGFGVMLAFGASVFSGCTGSVGEATSGAKGDGKFEDDGLSEPIPVVEVVDDSGRVVGTRPTFACRQDAAPTSIGLRKLIASQYKNTLRDLITAAMGGDATESMKIMSELAPALGKYPAEERERVAQSLHGSYRQLDQDMQQANVDASYQIATQAASLLVQGGRLAKLVGTCASDSNTANDSACINDFIKKFGELALRRPLDAEDVNFYRGFYGDATGIDSLGFVDVITGLLSAPQFLYMLEHGDKPVPNKRDVYELSAYELAARLSYHFTQTMPDPELLQAAKSGALTTEAEYQKQVDRLMNDARTRNASQEFFRDYLRVEDLPALDAFAEKKDFKALFADVPVTNMLRQNMMADPVDMFQYFTWDKPGTVRDVLTTEKSFARTTDLAKIYGTTSWDGQSDPPSLPAGERPGFLTRAAFLATGLMKTRPIMKGVFIRTNVLCDVIPSPPQGAANTPVDTTNRTTREAVELITEGDKTTCSGCHRTLINGLGYPTENFDALGRLRKQEVHFSEDGRETARLDINTRTVPRVFEEDEREVKDAGELMARIVESGKAEACIARNYFRFTFARWEGAGDEDNCTLERIRRTLDQPAAEGGGFKAMFRTVAFAPEFRSRRIVP